MATTVYPYVQYSGMWTSQQQMQAKAAGTWTAGQLPSTIGQAFGGGYYAGKITDGGVGYYLIVAPKATGENTSIQWKITNDAGPTGVQTLTNGPGATLAMFNAGAATYPAAAFCHNLSIGGYSDWYMPARDELEILYRAFKPTTQVNGAYDRYANNGPGFGSNPGDFDGLNANSIPAGAAYTSGSPAQTAVAQYITVSGTEAFTATIYWSSTEFTATFAWRQGFPNGYQ